MTIQSFVPRAVRMLLLPLLFASGSPAWAENILIIGHEFRTDTSDKLRAQLADHRVTIVNAVPASLAGYDVVWDLQFNTPLTTNQALYLNYLNSGRRLFIVGKHAGFMHRNNTVVDLIKAAGGGD